MHARLAYSEKSVFIAGIEIASSPMRQNDFTAKWNTYAWTGFSKYVNVHLDGVEKAARGCVITGSVEHFLQQTMDGMVSNGMEDVGGWRLRQPRTKKSTEGSYY